MKKFDDLEFKPTRYGSGIIAKCHFSNGYGVSVVMSPYSFGGERGLYELAVETEDGHLCYDTPVTSDVEGHLQPEDVTRLMQQVQELPQWEGCSK